MLRPAKKGALLLHAKKGGAIMVRVAILDDYQDVALQMTDWSVLPAEVEVQVFRDHLKDQDAVVERLKDCEIIKPPNVAAERPVWPNSFSSASTARVIPAVIASCFRTNTFSSVSSLPRRI